MNVNIFVKNMSYSDLYGPMKITDQAQADEYFEQLVTRNLSFGTNSRDQAERIERDNLAYFVAMGTAAKLAKKLAADGSLHQTRN